MAVRLDNLDDVLKQMAQMEKAVELEVIREARKKMRAVMRTLIPLAKRASPRKTGELAKNIKVQSRSRRGVSTAKVIWLVPYAGPVNFRKTTKTTIGSALGVSLVRETERQAKSLGFATDLWEQEKGRLDSIGADMVKDTFKEVLERHGVKVENT
jgi:hypothetical protein